METIITKITPRNYLVNNSVVYNIETSKESASTINENLVLDDNNFEFIAVDIYLISKPSETETVFYYLDKLIEDGDTYNSGTSKFAPKIIDGDGDENYQKRYRRMLLEEIGKKAANNNGYMSIESIKQIYKSHQIMFGNTSADTPSETIVYNGKRYGVKEVHTNDGIRITDLDISSAITASVSDSFKKNIVNKLKTLDNLFYSGITEDNITIVINA